MRLLPPFAAISFVPAPAGFARPDAVFNLLVAPIEIVTNDESFLPFAKTVGAEVERLLGLPAAVDDPGTLKMLLSSRVHLAHYFRDDEKAVATAAWIRSLQTDSSVRAFTGLTTIAAVETRRKNPGVASVDAKYRETFLRELGRQLADLPRTPEVLAMLRGQREKIAGMSEAALLAETRDSIAPSIERRGSCGLAEADRLVRVRHRLANILPVKGETLRAIDAAIASRS